MKLDIELAVGEQIMAVVVRTTGGKLELRETGVEIIESGVEPAEPQSFYLPAVTVTRFPNGRDNTVAIRKDDHVEHVPAEQCRIPESWPREIEVAAVAHLGPGGSLVLSEPRCLACGGTGRPTTAPHGWVGGSCLVCGGTGDFVARPAAPERGSSAAPVKPLPQVPPPPAAVEASDDDGWEPL